MAELYWMALARDVPFTRYVEDPAGVIRAAVADLNNFAYFFSGPTYRQAYGFAPEPSYSNNPPNTWWPPEQRGLPVAARASKRPLRLTRRKLFRGFTAGDQVGPYVSQLLLRDIPYGSQVIPGRIRTLDPNVNFMTSYDEWLIVQNGCDREQTNCDDVRRFIRNGRDLGQFRPRRHGL